MRYLKNESKRYVFWFILLAAIAILCIVGIFITSAYAGVEMITSGKLRIISVAAVQDADFDLRLIQDKFKKGVSIKDDLESIARSRKLYRATEQILDKSFIVDGDNKLTRILEAGELSEKGGGFAFGEIEVQKIADRIYKQIVSSSSVADIDAINGVLYQIIDKAKQRQSFKAEAKELERIRKIIHDAKERAEEVLTDAELEKLLEQARSVLAKAKAETEEILENAITRQNFGAMVFCGSEVIE